MIRYTILDSPLGDVLVARSERGLAHINFQQSDSPVSIQPEWTRDDSAFEDVAVQLSEYFAGKRQTFDLPLDPVGTEFQQGVWRVLVEIPFGETWTYGEIARRLGQPTASRAVGAANGRNPLPIVVPCHRVIGSNGKLTGYRGGVKFKEALLELEGALPGNQPALI